MAIITNQESINKGKNIVICGYAYNEKTPADKKLIYEIYKNKQLTVFHPYASKYYFFDHIKLYGFVRLPELFKPNGFSKNKMLDVLNRAFKGKNIIAINIHNEDRTQLINKGRNKHLHISYKQLQQLSGELGSMNYLHSRNKTIYVNNFFHGIFPKLIKAKSSLNSKEEIGKAIQTLATNKVDEFETQDINKIIDILTTMMKSGHKSRILKSELFKNTKLKIDTITFDQVINEFESKLKDKVSEEKWGKFLQSNLFLIDSKYIHAISQLNLVLGGSRKVDFGLVDIQGYLDIFEIKKPETKLISANKDSRGNYVWDKQAIEAIVQAEKYLFHAESKRNDLKADIKRERQIVLDVIRPRAFVILGTYAQLDNDDKKEDFRILKNQFKNIEIILYDELLERIKNQKKSIEK